MRFTFLVCVLIGPAAGQITRPVVLCIGDSITHGWAAYTPWECPRDNGRSTRYALAHLSEWTRNLRYGVIVFNFGLWDIREGVPTEEYKSNLRTIVQRLKADRVFFCNITPGRAVMRGYEPEKIDAYNRAAVEVMRTEHILIIDLYGAAMGHREWWKKDVHFTARGYEQMARIVVDAIKR